MTLVTSIKFRTLEGVSTCQWNYKQNCQNVGPGIQFMRPGQSLLKSLMSSSILPALRSHNWKQVSEISNTIVTCREAAPSAADVHVLAPKSGRGSSDHAHPLYFIVKVWYIPVIVWTVLLWLRTSLAVLRGRCARLSLIFSMTQVSSLLLGYLYQVYACPCMASISNFKVCGLVQLQCKQRRISVVPATQTTMLVQCITIP